MGATVETWATDYFHAGTGLPSIRLLHAEGPNFESPTSVIPSILPIPIPLQSFYCRVMSVTKVVNTRRV